MQIVGRSCAICQVVFKNELGAFGCEACELAVHDGCVDRAGAGYRDDASGKARPRRRKGVPCPGCGADLRARKRADDRERDRVIAIASERRARRERLRNLLHVRGSVWLWVMLAVGVLRVGLALARWAAGY